MHIHSPVFSGSITQAAGAYSVLSGSFTGSYTGDGSGLTGVTATLPANVVSSSAQISSSGFLTSESAASLGFGSGGGGGVTNYSELSNIPANIVSSSTQVENLGFVTNANTASFITAADTGSFSTGSSIVTASNTLNVITFTKGDGTTFGMTIHTGSGGGGGSTNYNALTNVPEGIVSSSTQIDALGFITASKAVVSSSAQVLAHVSASNLHVASITASGDITANRFHSTATGNASLIGGSNLVLSASNAVSINGGVLRLPTFTNAQTGSLTLSDGDLIYNSDRDKVLFYSASAFNEFGTGNGSGVSSYADLTNIPAGIVSSSAQILSLAPTGSNVVTASSALNVVTFTQGDGSTFDITIHTGSGGSGGVTNYNALTNVPSGIVSASNQLNDTTIENLTLTGSIIISGALLPEDDGTGNGIHDIGSVTQPFRDLYLTTSSLNFVQDGVLFSSINAAENAIRVGNILITTSSIKAIDNSDNSVVSIIETSNSGMTASLTVPFDGDRTVTNTNAGDWHGTNLGTSGSLVDFINALFFPNTPPAFTLAANQSIDEFTASGSTAFTVTATDADSDAITFSAPLYTGSFLTITAGGVVTMQSESSATDHNINDRGDGTLAYPFPVRAADPNSGETDRTYYLRINPNNAPQWRQTSLAGSVVTGTVNTDRIESSGTGNVVSYFITDADSDTLSITGLYSSSNHFDIITASNNTSVTIRQQTGSLEFDGGITTYNFNFTASDEHGATAALAATVTVTDNAAPTFNNQTETGASEASDAGAVFGQASATDSDSLTYRNFAVARRTEGGTLVAAGTYGNTGPDDPSEDPFSMNSSGQITLKSGHYLNSDQIDSYEYSASVYDTFNDDVYAVITIPVSDDPAPTLTNNSAGGLNTYYISETAVSSSTLRTGTNGVGGSTADYNANQSPITWSVSPDDVFSINTAGNLSVNTNISGAYSGSQTIAGTVSGSNNFGTQTISNFTLNVVVNSAPSVTFNLSSSITTDNDSNGDHIGTFSITDTENNVPFSVELNKDLTSSLEIVPNNANSSSWDVNFTGSDPGAGDYTVAITASDSYGTSTSITGSYSITEASVDGIVYLYHTNGASANRGATAYNTWIGLASENSNFTPPSASLVTTYTNALHAFRDGTGGGLGASSITGLYGNTVGLDRLDDARSGSNLDDVLAQSAYSDGSPNSGTYILAISSGSDMTGVPQRMRDNVGGNAVGEYVWATSTGGNFGASTTHIHTVCLDTAHMGFREWIFIIRDDGTTPVASNNNIRIVPSSGSLPSI